MEQSPVVTLPEDGKRESEPRSVEHEYSLNWAPILRRLRASLLISTYQAGKVVAVSEGREPDEPRSCT